MRLSKSSKLRIVIIGHFKVPRACCIEMHHGTVQGRILTQSHVEPPTSNDVMATLSLMTLLKEGFTKDLNQADYKTSRRD